jgi:hypothetical protein
VIAKRADGRLSPDRTRVYPSRMARIVVLKPKAIAVMTVKRSRLRSTTLEEAAAEPIPPPNISERPPPFPLCSRIEMTRVMHSTIWIAMDTHVITT